MPTARKPTKYLPISLRAKAWTDCTIPDRVNSVPRIHRKKVALTSTMFQIFIMPFFSCIITECRDRKSTRLNSSHLGISYAVFCLKKKQQDERSDVVGGPRSPDRLLGQGSVVP